jgi:hypothetical protein
VKGSGKANLYLEHDDKLTQINLYFHRLEMKAFFPMPNECRNTKVYEGGRGSKKDNLKCFLENKKNTKIKHCEPTAHFESFYRLWWNCELLLEISNRRGYALEKKENQKNP